MQVYSFEAKMVLAKVQLTSMRQRKYLYLTWYTR